MDLIYADSNLTDLGVLQDYSFDECYGDEDNTFQCKVQKYNHVCREDYILYAEFTEYGGIIDRIEIDIKTGEVVYSGRTWHGVLNSFIIEPPQGFSHRVYSGEANEVLQEMINDVGMGSLFVVDIDDPSGIDIVDYRVRYGKVYDTMMEMLKEYQGKLYMYYIEGQVHIGACLSVNYAGSEEFDSSQEPFKMGKTYNNVNHLICLGAGENDNRAVIHLFTSDLDGDGDGVNDIQPYIKLEPIEDPTEIPREHDYYEREESGRFVHSMDNAISASKTYYQMVKPAQDSDYILDKSQQVMFGKDEIAQVFDSKNSEITTNYLPQLTEPSDWKTAYYTKYYQKEIDETTGKEKYSLFKQRKKTAYKLLTSPPGDWYSKNGYEKYYMWDDNAERSWYYQNPLTGDWIKLDEYVEGAVEKTGKLIGVRAYTESEHPERVTYSRINTNDPPAKWKVPNDNDDGYTQYYRPKGNTGEYEKIPLKTKDTYNKISKCPPDWGWNFSSYYSRKKDAAGQWVYSSIEGKHNYIHKPIKKKPKKWEDEWSSYYFKHTIVKKDKKGKVVKKESEYISANEAIDRNIIQKENNKSYPKFKSNVFYVRYSQDDTHPQFSKISGGVFSKTSTPILEPYVKGRYYEKMFNELPEFKYKDNTFNGYYEKKAEDVEIIPLYHSNNCYYEVKDRYAKLVEDGIKKIRELNDTSTLDIDLKLESNYDVGDIVGGVDIETGVDVTKPILRKIIKIKKDILSIEYEVD